MTATVEFQQGLFDEPFKPHEMRSVNLIASYLPDATTLGVERDFAGRIALKVTLRLTVALAVDDFPLGDEHEIGVQLAGELGHAVAAIGKKL